MDTLVRLGRILKVADPDTKESLRNCFARWSYSFDNYNESLIKNGTLHPDFEADLNLRLVALEDLYSEELAASFPTPSSKVEQ